MKDFIPWHQLQPPRVVWAEPEETVESIRQRLQQLPPPMRFTAPLLIRLPQRHIAPADVRMLRHLAQAEGPAILQRQVGDLLAALCPPPWSVQSQGPDYTEAVAAAASRRLPVIAVEDGLRAGLVLPPDEQTIPVALGPHLFDLFDDPLSRAALATEFIVVDIDAALAQVGRELNSLAEPQEAHIVIGMGDGSWRAASALALNQAALAAGADIWSAPLRRLGDQLRPAESRELSALGRKQARYLAERHDYLVVTEEGQPIGLLVGQGLMSRLASAKVEATGDHDLFRPPDLRQEDTLPEERVEQVPRFVNVWFQDAQHQRVDRSEPLIMSDAPYYLALNVGRLLAESIVDWGREPGGPQAIVEPQEAAYLYVSLFSKDFDIPEPTQALWLPPENDSQVLTFEIQPRHPSWGAGFSRLEVCLYYRTYLVQTLRVQVQVVASNATAARERPQVAELTHARTAGFPDMAGLPVRGLSLTINRAGPDRYQFTFLVDPDPQSGEAAQEAIRLACQVRLSRDDLSHMITKARRQLYNVVRSFDRLQGGDEQLYRRATRALAQVGRQLYLKLFETDSAQALRDWMEANLAPGSTIQIVDLAGDFVFPWSLVYTAPPWEPDTPIEVDRFWGWRYQLVILTADMLDTYRQASPVIGTAAPLRISVGLYERLKGIKAQKEFFAGLGLQTDPPLEAEVVNDRRAMRRALTQADRDVYYFFCHGYTERVATDIQLDADLVALFGRAAAEGEGGASQAVRDHLEDLFDVSDSWLRLTRGKLPLAMLKEVVPRRFARQPLVFLNMCQSAQVLPSLSDGFVPFFIRRGARAVIGTECSMDAAFADEFARNFWLCFLQGRTAGEVLLSLRRHYLDQHNPLALAYTLYSDADLRLDRGLLPGGGRACAEDAAEAQGAAERSQRMSQADDRREAVEVLWEDDMDGLMLALAARLKAEEEGFAGDELRRWNPPEEAFALEVEAGPEWTARMLELAQRWWQQLEPRLFALLCRPGPERDELMKALKEGARMLAVALAPALVAQAAALPAVAIVVATIAAKKIADAGLEAACELWQESMTEAE